MPANPNAVLPTDRVPELKTLNATLEVNSDKIYVSVNLCINDDIKF